MFDEDRDTQLLAKSRAHLGRGAYPSAGCHASASGSRRMRALKLATSSSRSIAATAGADRTLRGTLPTTPAELLRASAVPSVLPSEVEAYAASDVAEDERLSPVLSAGARRRRGTTLVKPETAESRMRKVPRGHTLRHAERTCRRDKKGHQGVYVMCQSGPGRLTDVNVNQGSVLCVKHGRLWLPPKLPTTALVPPSFLPLAHFR